MTVQNRPGGPQRRIIGLVLGVGIVVGAGFLVWYLTSTQRWPQENRDAFVRACTFSGGISVEISGKTPDPQLVLGSCECMLRELERRLSVEDFRRDEALMLAGGFRPTPTMETAMVACGVPLEVIRARYPGPKEQRLNQAKKDAQILAQAISMYWATFGEAPPSLDVLAEQTTKSGIPGGPFVSRIPRPPLGWSGYSYSTSTDGTFTITTSGDGTTVRVP